MIPNEAALAAVLGDAERFEPTMSEGEGGAKLAAWRRAVAAVVGYARG